jgi:predicted permease
MMPSVNPPAREWNTRHYWWLTVMGRLKPGATLQSARSELDVLWHQILKADPEVKPAPAYDKERDKYDRAVVLPGSAGWSYFRVQFSKPLTVLMIVVGLVLLIACANVANLLLARAASRQKEIAIRLAIGAGRGRLVRQLVLETLVISVLGGVAGLLFGWWGTNVLVGLLPARTLPIDLHIAPDARMLGFCFGVSILTGLACGLLPAFQATRPDLSVALKNGLGSGRRRRFDLRRSLVMAQVAISLLLLIGAGLFVRSLRNLRTLDAGFTRERVLLVDVNAQPSGYKGQRLRDFYEQLRARVAALPEARSVALAAITPLAGSRWNGDVSIEGYRWKPNERPYLDFNAVAPGYFTTLGIPMLAGRDFRDTDNPVTTADRKPGEPDDDTSPPARVAIINETMAKRFFGRESPIGRRFSRKDKFKMEGSFEIVGVVKDANYFGLRKKVESMIYIPVWRDGARGVTLCIRSASRPERLEGAVRQEAARLDAAVPVTRMLTLERQYDDNIAQERMVTTLCGFFGVLALLLAAIGLYGVMAQSVSRRVREIGIRMALGARSTEVLGLVLRETAWMVGIGALVGIPAAFALTRLVTSFLYGLTPQDPLSIVVSTLVLFAVTALAGYIPARRATKVDPMVALRYE